MGVNFKSLPTLLTIDQVSKIFSIHPNTLRNWDKTGKLKAVRIGVRKDRRYENETVEKLYLELLPSSKKSNFGNENDKEKLPEPEVSKYVIQPGWSFEKIKLLWISKKFSVFIYSVSLVAFAFLTIQVTFFTYIFMVQADENSSKIYNIILEPTEVSGWMSAENAKKVDLLSNSPKNNFTKDNSAFFNNKPIQVLGEEDEIIIPVGTIDEVVTSDVNDLPEVPIEDTTTEPEETIIEIIEKPDPLVEEIEVATEVEDIVVEIAEPELVVPNQNNIFKAWGYSIPDSVLDTALITRISLYVSFAADTFPDNEDVVILSYSVDDGDTWQIARSISLYEEVSNATNEGYFKVDIDNIYELEEFNKFQVKLDYNAVPGAEESTAYLDGLFFDIELQEAEKVVAEIEQSVTIEDNDLTVNEKPIIEVDVEEESSFAFLGVDPKQRVVTDIQLLNPKGEVIEATYTVEKVDKGKIKTDKYSFDNAKFDKPGKYQVKMIIDQEGVIKEIIQDFTWGVLAINPDFAIQKIGQETLFSIGVLDHAGDIVCNADVVLDIIDPNGNVITKKTADGTITISEFCQIKGEYHGPDYFATYTTDVPGTYQINVTATHYNGTNSISDTFQIKESPRFTIQRDGPTRVFPYIYQPMTLKVTAYEDIVGEIKEIVNSDYELKDYGDASLGKYDSGTEILNTLSWNRTIKAGESIEVTYNFKTPEESPALYFVGPASVGDTWDEGRQWQMAIDATYLYLLGADSTPGAGWTNITTYDGDFVRGASAFSTSGGAATHSHTFSTGVGSGSSSTGPDTICGRGCTLISTGAHTHTANTTTVAAADNNPAHYTYYLYRYDSLDSTPSTIPLDAFAFFKTGSEPSSPWVRFSAADSRLVKLDSSHTTGGSDTHTHGVTWGSLNAGSGSVGVFSGITPNVHDAIVHTHAAPSTPTTTASATSVPEYVTLKLYEQNGTPPSVPIGMIALFDGTPPTGWTTISNTSPYQNRYIQTADSSGTTSGSAGVAHSNTVGTSGDSAGIDGSASAGSQFATAGHKHDITLSGYNAPAHDPLQTNFILAECTSCGGGGGGYDFDGIAYTDDTEGTPITTGTSVCVAVNATAGGDCDATDSSGNFSITGVTTSAGDQLTFYIDGGSILGNTVTVSDGGDIVTGDNLRIYQNTVMVRHEQGTSINVDDMDAYDNDQNSVDMLYDAIDAITDTLVVETGIQLFVYTGHTFDPNGRITTTSVTGDFDVRGTAYLDTISNVIAGDIDVPSGGTLHVQNSTIVEANEVLVSGGTLNHTAGTFIIGNSTTEDLNMTSGAVNISGGTTDIGDDFILTGGTATISGSADVDILDRVTLDGATSVLNLNAGSVVTEVGYWVINEGDFNFNGGTHSVGPSGYFYMAPNDTGLDFTMTGSGTITTEEINLSNTALARWGTISGGTFIIDDDNSVGGIDIRKAGVSFYNIVIADTTTIDVNSLGFNVANDLTINGSQTFGTTNEALSIGGDLVINSSAVFTAGSSAISIAGDYTNGGTFTADTSTVTMTGTSSINGASDTTFNNLTIGDGTAGTVTVGGSEDPTVTGTFDIDSGDTLSLGVSNIVTLGNAGSLTLDGTISGGGLFAYQPSSAFPTTGTLSSSLRMDATFNDQILSQRTYGHQVQVYNNSTTNARTVMLGTGASQTLNFSNSLYVSAQNTQNITLDGGTYNPTVNITSVLAYGGGGSGIGIITSGTGMWTVSGAIDFTDGTYTATSGNTVVLDGSSTQTITSDSESFYNLTVTNTSGIVTGCASFTTAGIVFADAATATGTFTVNDNANVEYNSTSTYAFTNIDWTGSSGNEIYFKGSTGSSAWDLDVTNSSVVSYVDVSWSDATPGVDIDADDGTNTDCSNNTAWTFPSSNTNVAGSSNSSGTVKIAVNGVLQADSFVISASAWNVDTDPALSGGEVITVFIDTATDGDQSTAVTEYDGADDITGMVLNQNVLSVGSADTGVTLTVTQLGSYDNDQNGNIMHTANAGVLNVDEDGAYADDTIDILADDTLTMDSAGTMNAHNVTISIDGTLASDGANTYSLDGNWDNNGTFTASTSTVTMTGSPAINGSSDTTFNNLTIGDGSAGTVSIEGTDDPIVTGTLDVNTNDFLYISIDRSLTVTSTGSFTFDGYVMGNGTLVYQPSAAFPTTGAFATNIIVRFDSSSNSQTMSARDYLYVEIYGNNSSNTVTSAAGTYNVYGDLELIQGGTGATTFDLNTNDPTINFTKTITIGVNTIFSAPSSTSLTLKSDYTNNGTFTDNSGTVVLAGTVQQTLSGTMTGSSDFYNLTITNTTGSVSGCATSFTPGIDFAAAATATGTFTVNDNVKVEYNSGSTYAFTNIDWTGSSGNDIVFRNSNLTSGTWLLDVANTSVVSYVDVSRSDATDTGFQIDADDGTNTHCGNNTNWLFSDIITIGGTVYQENKSTNAGSGILVQVNVNGNNMNFGTTDGNGDYSVGSIASSSGDIVTIYLDDHGTYEGTTAFKVDGTDTADVDVYAAAVIVRNDTGASITNTNLESGDRDTGDSDIKFKVDSNNVTIDSEFELHIWTGDTYDPGGGVTTSGTGGNQYVDTGATVQGTGSLVVHGGNLTGDGTVNMTGGTVTLSTDGTIGGDSNWTFYNLSFTQLPCGEYTTTAIGTGSMTITNQLITTWDFCEVIERFHTLDAGEKTWILSGSGTTDETMPFFNEGRLIGNTSTFQYTGTGDTDIARDGSGGSYYNLELIPSGGSPSYTFEYASALANDINNNLTIGDGTNSVTIDGADNNVSLDVGGNFSCGASTNTINTGTGTWNIEGNVDLTNCDTFTATSGHTLVMDGVTPSLTAAGKSLYDFETSGTGTITLADALTTNGDVTVGTGTTLTGSNDLTANGGDITGDGVITMTGGTVTVGLPAAGNIGGNSSTWTFYDLYFDIIGACSGDRILSATGSGDIKITNTLARDTCAGAGDDVWFAKLSAAAGGAKTWEMSGSGTPITSMVIVNKTTEDSTFKFTNTGSVTVSGGGSFDNLSLDPDSGGTYDISGDISVYGDLYIKADLTDLIEGTGEVIMHGADNTIDVGGETFYDFKLDSASDVAISVINTDFTISSAYGNFGAGGTLSIGAGRTVTHTGSTFANLGTVEGAGTLRFTDTSAGPGTGGTINSIVRYDASAGNIANTTFDARTYGGDVELYGSNSSNSITAASGSYPISGDLILIQDGTGATTVDLNTNDPSLVVSGDVSIDTATTLSASSSSTLDINGNYTNNGTFTDNNGTVVLAGSSTQSLSGTMTGSSDFYNLTITNSGGTVDFGAAVETENNYTITTAGVTVEYEAGSTYTFPNINWAGSSGVGNEITFQSSTTSDWNLVVTGTQTDVSYIDVKYSYACGGDWIDASNGTNTDSGNNDCWIFDGITLTGTIYSDDGISVYDCSADPLTVHAATNGGTASEYECDSAGGTFTIPATDPTAGGDPIVLYIDNSETPHATTATLAADISSNISGLNLYQNRMIVRHENAGPMTNAKLLTGDNADAGIRYAVIAGALTTESGMELHAWTGDTFDPGGMVTTDATGGNLHIDDNATVHLDTATSIIGLDIDIDANATLNVSADATVNGDNITSAGNINVTAGTLTIGNGTTEDLIINGGTNSFSGGTVDVKDNFYVNGGTATIASAVTVAGNIWQEAGTLNFNTGANVDVTGALNMRGSNSQITNFNDGSVDVGTNINLNQGIITLAGGTVRASTVADGAIELARHNDGGETVTFNMTGGTLTGRSFIVYNEKPLTTTTVTGGTIVIDDPSGASSAQGQVYQWSDDAPEFYNLQISRGTVGTPCLLSNDASQQLLVLKGNYTLDSGIYFDAQGEAMEVQGDWTNNSGNFTPGTGSVTLTGENVASHDINGLGDTTFYDLTIGDGATTNTITVDTDTGADDPLVSNTLDVDTGDSLAIETSRTVTWTGSGFTLDGTISGAGRLTINSGTTIPTAGTLSSLVRFDTSNGNTTTMPARTYGSDVEIFNDDNSTPYTITPLATATQDIDGNLYIIADGTQNVTFAGVTNNPAFDIEGDFDFIGADDGSEIITSGTGTWTVSGNVNFTDGTYTATSGNTLVMNGTGTLTSASQTLQNLTLSGSVTLANATHTMAGNLDMTGGTVTAGTSTIDMTGATKTVTSASQTLQNFKVSGTGSVASADAMDVNGTFDIADTGVFTQEVDSNLNAAGNFTLASGTTFNNATAGTGELILDGDLTFTDNTSPQQDVGNLEIGTSPDTTDLASDLLAKTLTINDGDILNTNGYDLDIGLGGITISTDAGSGGGTLDVDDDVETDGTQMNTDGKFDLQSGASLLNSAGTNVGSTLTFNIPSSVSDITSDLITAGTGSLYNLVIDDGAGTYNLIVEVEDPLVVLNNVTITNGHLDAVSGENNAITVGGSWDNDDIFLCRSGTITFDATSGSPTIDSTGATTDDFNDITFDDTGNNITFTLESILDINNDLLITGGTLDVKSGEDNAIYLAGDWTNNDNFTDQSGTVYLDGSSQQILSGQMTGTSDRFYNLTITNAGASDPDVDFAAAADVDNNFTADTANTQLEFNAGSTYTFNNVSFNGTSGNLVTLRSSTPGTQWNLTSDGTQIVTYTDVQDSYACGGDTIDATGGTNVNSQNNDCWLFVGMTVSLSPNSIDLGTLLESLVSQDGVTLTVSTDASNGYQASVYYDNSLTSIGNTIADTTGGTIVAGTEEYGASSSRSGYDIGIWSPTSCADTGTTSNATALTTSLQTFAGATGVVSTHQTELCILGSISGLTDAGAYTSTITIVATSLY
ncbi:MAG: MerR family transcriptional regulator [Candidatus Kerfeldbacteria bacterium]